MNSIVIEDIYLNLNSGTEVNSSDIWHLSIVIDTSNYNMPSIVIGIAEIAIYENILFDEVTSIPTDFDDMIIAENEMFEYGGEHEILSYDITIHKVGVTNPNYIYLLRFGGKYGQTFKLQFIEYQSGITVLKYNLLSDD